MTQRSALITQLQQITNETIQHRTALCKAKHTALALGRRAYNVDSSFKGKDLKPEYKDLRTLCN